jgi:hypothetical protein
VKPLPFSQDDVNRAIERLTSVLEDEFGNDIAAWASATLVLLLSIIDKTDASRQDVAELILKQPHHGDLQ